MHKWVTYIFLGLALVLIVTHPQGFAGAVTSVGGQAYNESSLLAGQGMAGGTTGVVTGGKGTYSVG